MPKNITQIVEPITDGKFEDVAKKIIGLTIKKYPNTCINLFNDNFSHKFPNPQYLGAKFKHLNWLKEFLPKNIKKVADAFAGSQSVSFFFKQLGYEVYTNDFMNYSNHIGKALIENNEKFGNYIQYYPKTSFLNH